MTSMRLGLAGGPLPLSSEGVTPELAVWLAARGVRTLAFHLGDAERLIGGEAARIRQLLADHGISVAQSTGYQPNLVDPDAEVRAEAAARIRRGLAVAEGLSAVMVNTGVGSMHASFPYGPHPANHSPEAVATLIANLRVLCPEAEDRGLLLSLEPHVMTTVSDPDTIRDVMDGVGHAALRVNFDPVNLLGSLPEVYDNARCIDRMGDRLAPYLAPSAHVKDIRPAPALVVHLDEVAPGEGFLDWDAYFRVCRTLGDGAALIVEHLHGSAVEDALAYTVAMAAANGIAVA
jgi:sugar phosphate isomerase/epimerase